MRARLLGSGTSSGVPRIGNDWGACDPDEPKNRRTRASLLVEHDATRVLVDTSPDMRAQLLDAGVARLDAVIWTHDHADHCHGLDDLRQVFHALGEPVRGLARPEVLTVLRQRFAYAFEGRTGYPPVVRDEPLPDAIAVDGIGIRVVDQPHGDIFSSGLRFTANGKSIGYATDFHEMTDAMRALYSDLDIWVVDALRLRPHPTHPHLDQVLGWIAELRPRRAVLMHMDNSMDYAALKAALPAGVEPGYDGMELIA